jgi:hypothetical protein
LFGLDIKNQADTQKHGIELGHLIPTQSPDSFGNYSEGFRVIDVDSGKYFVLKGWGTFYIRETGNNISRLIIRTNFNKPVNIMDELENFVFEALHHIMEKRMMLGIKDQAESNGENHYNYFSDLIWFLSIVITGFAGIFMVFFANGYQKLFLPSIFYTLWHFTLLIFNPLPLFGIILLLTAAIFIILIKKNNASK